MSRLSFPAFLSLAACAIFATASVGDISALAQENVKIVTADGVKLHAVFYASDKKNPATVIMLHPIGESKSSKGQDWKNLAESLQKANYSVIMFDFRGHGESTAIDNPQLFWTKPTNAANVKVKNKKDETIDVKDYLKSPAYLPNLCNDIAAVRSYLDIRNDNSKDCNTSSLIVIGAESGATLGSIWMNSEWHRYKYTPPMGIVTPSIFPNLVARTSEGKDIIAAVFLSVQPTLEKRTISVPGALKIACKDNGTAAAFFCAGENAKDKDFAKTLESKLKVKGKKHDYIGAVPLATNLTGVKLLQKGLETDKYIVKYLDNVMEDRKSDRVDREFMTSYFVWKMGNGYLPARTEKSEKNIMFTDYNKYIPQ